MNPARTLGPAIAGASYKGIWVYILGPVTGALLGAWSYSLIQDQGKPVLDISQSSSLSFLLRQKISEIEQISNNNHDCSA